MKLIIKQIIKAIIPFYKRRDYKKWQLRKNILSCLEKDINCYEKKEVYTFLKKFIGFFPYEFIKNYNLNTILVYEDNDCGLKYVLQENKRLYFKFNWTEK
jgi:hypothetical protein